MEATRGSTSTSSEASFLADIAMMKPKTSMYREKRQENELERYCIIGEGDTGTDDPLNWWKVRQLYFIVT